MLSRMQNASRSSVVAGGFHENWQVVWARSFWCDRGSEDRGRCMHGREEKEESLHTQVQGPNSHPPSRDERRDGSKQVPHRTK